MNMRRSLFPFVSLPLLLAMMPLWWIGPGLAQTATMTATTTVSTSTSSTTTTTTTSASVPVSGVVTGTPESVKFSGLAKLSASVVTDPDFGGIPTVVLTIDLSGLKGVGASTGATYATSDQVIVQRRLAAADTVQYNFPFNRSGTTAMSPSLGLASFNLSFNVNALSLVAATGSIGSSP